MEVKRIKARRYNLPQVQRSVLWQRVPMKVECVAGEDPFHVLAYDRAAMERQGKIGEGSSTGKTAHLFRAVAQTADRPVTVRVTDSFGRKYVRSIRRPHAYDLEMEQREVEGRIR